MTNQHTEKESVLKLKGINETANFLNKYLHTKVQDELDKLIFEYNKQIKILEENPTIQVVIDLHRDGVGENTRLVTKQNGKKMAKIMFFNGLSRTTAAGDIAYLKNPYIADNLAFSFSQQSSHILAS